MLSSFNSLYGFLYVLSCARAGAQQLMWGYPPLSGYGTHLGRHATLFYRKPDYLNFQAYQIYAAGTSLSELSCPSSTWQRLLTQTWTEIASNRVYGSMCTCVLFLMIPCSTVCVRAPYVTGLDLYCYNPRPVSQPSVPTPYVHTCECM